MIRALRFILCVLLLGACRLNAAEFDHDNAELDRTLRVVVTNGLVDYPALKKDSSGLDAWLTQAAAVKEDGFAKWSEPQRLAFLINLYNAATLRLILDHYPVASIKKIGGWFSGPWSQPVVRLFGKTLTLDVVEHGMLRVQFVEPRLHFAIVCAARGCPPLRAEAYTSARLEEQLQDQTRTFLGTTSKNRVDLKTRTLHLSPIFKWFAGDFIREHGSVAKFVAPYFAADLRKEIEQGGFTIRYTDYDWSLNEARGQGR